MEEKLFEEGERYKLIIRRYEGESQKSTFYTATVLGEDDFFVKIADKYGAIIIVSKSSIVEATKLEENADAFREKKKSISESDIDEESK